MKVRHPNFDFTKIVVHWARNPEFSQALNAGSQTPTVVEPYLNMVLARVRPQLGPEYTELQEKITIFVKQETLHYTVHNKYDAAIVAAGYPRYAEFVQQRRKEYNEFLKSRSLQFNMAYAEGFESYSHAFAEFYFERLEDLLEGANETVKSIWLWHLAEEYEHRSVCYEVYKAAFGGYFRRVYGLLFAFFHIGGWNKKVIQYLLSVDREHMTEEQKRESQRSERRYNRRVAGFVIPRTLLMAVPWYDPRKRRPPRGAEALLRKLEQAGA